MHYTIYKVTNTINNKIYIGKHQTKNLEDSYLGSGKALCAAIKLYGKEFFTKEIMFIFETEEEMNAKEKELIDENFVNSYDTYNMGIGGEGGAHFKGKKHTEETKAKIKASLSTPENIKLNSFRTLGRKHTEEAKLKMRKNRRKTSGTLNGSYGKHWITDGHKNMMVINSLEIPSGWFKGRVILRNREAVSHQAHNLGSR